jgi:iron complex transport system ATP-binding protein
MRKDKAALLLDGVSLLDRISRVAAELGYPVRIIQEDAVERCGPIGGILTAFIKSRTGRILFLSCDMPFISTEFLRSLIGGSLRKGGVVFSASKKASSPVGFPFILPRSLMPIIREQIANKDFSLQELACKSGADVISPQNAQELFNINTPADLKKAEQFLKEDAVLSVRNLTIRRGGTVILRDLTWKVRPGENWVILGANGSGKTSLLTALMGFMTPTSGVVRVLGKEYGRADWRNLRLQIGLVSSAIRQMMGESEPALLSVVSGKYAQIDYWGKPKPSDRKEALRILDQVECRYLADRPWLYLSQGERQRVLIGRALMAKPAVLILDEPCAGLDPAARENFLQFIQRLSTSRKAPTLVLVTHHVEEIMAAFTHALLLKSGETLAAGPLKTVLTSANCSAAFDAPMRPRKSGDRYRLDLLQLGKRMK